MCSELQHHLPMEIALSQDMGQRAVGVLCFGYKGRAKISQEIMRLSLTCRSTSIRQTVKREKERDKGRGEEERENMF